MVFLLEMMISSKYFSRKKWITLELMWLKYPKNPCLTKTVQIVFGPFWTILEKLGSVDQQVELFGRP